MTQPSRKDLTPLAVRAAALWLAAGALFKLFAGTPADLPAVLHELPIPTDLFFKLAIGVELSLVCAAVLRPRLAWLPMVALFLLFDGILAVALSQGAESCGCFGSSVTIPPAVMMGIDSVLLVGILLTRPWLSTSAGVGPAPLLPALVAACLVLPFPWIGSAEIQVDEETGGFDAQKVRYVMIEPESWKDQLVYDTDFARLFPEAIETLPTDGLYVFWRWTCDHCAEHLQRLADTDDGSRPIVLVRLTEAQDTPENRAVLAMPTGGHVTELALPVGPQYVIETPAEFVLEGGVVVSAEEGVR
jgi:hypothetical protein